MFLPPKRRMPESVCPDRTLACDHTNEDLFLFLSGETDVVWGLKKAADCGRAWIRPEQRAAGGGRPFWRGSRLYFRRIEAREEGGRWGIDADPKHLAQGVEKRAGHGLRPPPNFRRSIEPREQGGSGRSCSLPPGCQSRSEFAALIEINETGILRGVPAGGR